MVLKPVGLVSLEEGRKIPASFFSFTTLHTQKRPCEDISKKADIYKPGKETLSETNPGATLILDF